MHCGSYEAKVDIRSNIYVVFWGVYESEKKFYHKKDTLGGVQGKVENNFYPHPLPLKIAPKSKKMNFVFFLVTNKIVFHQKSM